jgi:hypothetical protein
MNGNSYISALFAVFMMLPIISCNELKPENAMQENKGILLFNSGFEAGSRIEHGKDPFRSDDDIVGLDQSVSPPNDWVEDIDNSSRLGRFSLQYQGGDTTMRFARIVPEPGNPNNKVLHFWMQYPNVDNGSKGRIQANIYENRNQRMEGIKELYQSVRLFLHEDMEVVKSYPDKISWLTILEVWNNIQWIDDPYPYRLTVGIVKPSAERRELYFMVDAQDYIYRTDTTRGRYVTLWHDMNQKVPVPIGQWMTLEYYMKEGNDETGRFYMAMTPEGGQKQVIFDIKNYTHNSWDPNPDGITLWNPLKLYTSRQLIHYVREQGKALQVFWDDFEVWKDVSP